MENLLIQMVGIYKYFSGVPALQDVGFELKRGEVHALMGENGAGKSTLSKIMTGIYRADAGQVFLNGEPVRFTSTKDAADHGVAIVTQEFSLLPDFSVAENIFLVDNNFYKGGVISSKNKMVKETYSLLKLFGMEKYIDPYAKVKTLSVAQMQLVEILKAIAKKSQAIILDEPTACLSTNEIHLLFDLVCKLRDEGVGFVIVSHKINEIYTISDRITVLRDGKMVVNAANTNELTQDKLIHAMVGREVSDLYGGAKPLPVEQVGIPALEVEGIADSRAYVHDVSFSVYPGEIVGISGLVGAGRTELVRCIFGADKRSAGIVRVKGRSLSAFSIVNSMKRKIGFVPEDRKHDGLLQELNIRFNICASKIVMEATPFVNRARQERMTLQQIEDLGIKLSDMEAPVRSLSGGNQQKVLLAKWLLIAPDVLIVDEPTRGVDIGAKADIYRILRALAQSGVAILMVSSEIPEILSLCNRILVMREGSISKELSAEEANEELIGYYATIG